MIDDQGRTILSLSFPRSSVGMQPPTLQRRESSTGDTLFY